MFDSVHDNISSDTVNQICSIVRSQKKSITIEIMDVVKQSGSTDCGLFGSWHLPHFFVTEKYQWKGDTSKENCGHI